MGMRPFLLIAMAVLVAGCGADAGTGSLEEAGETGDVILTVYVADEAVAGWTLAEFETEFEQVTIVIDGDEQTGPRLIDVLDASGVGEWSRADVLGKGEGRSFDVAVAITAAEVDETWVLDFSKRGTVKLASPELPKERWVRDAGEIRIP
jgi:hypothetical protein